MTAEAWIKSNNYAVTNQVIFSKYDEATGERAFKFLVTANGELIRFNMVIYDEDNTYTNKTTLSIARPAGWIHVAFSFKPAGYLIVYVNGVALDSTISLSSGIKDVGAAFRIGTYGDSSGVPVQAGCFDGLIDEVIIWNDERTPTEISESYNSGDGKEYIGNEANMVGYWRMNDDLLDLTSNNNDLTNNNSATFSSDVPFIGSSNPDAIFDITPVTATSTVNNVTVSTVKNSVFDITPVTGIANINDVIVTAISNAIFDITLVTGMATVNDIIISTTGSVIFDLTPVIGTATVNNVSIITDSIFSLTPVKGNATVNDITVISETAFDLTPIICSGIINNVVVSGDANFSLPLVTGIATVNDVTVITESNAIFDLAPIIGVAVINDVVVYLDNIFNITPVIGNATVNTMRVGLWTKRIKPTSSWTKRTKPTTSWIKR